MIILDEPYASVPLLDWMEARPIPCSPTSLPRS